MNWQMVFSPLLLSTWAVLLGMGALFAHVGGVLSRSNAVHRQQAAVRAEFLAEEVARSLAQGASFEGHQLHPGSGAMISVAPRGGTRFDVGVAQPGASRGMEWFCGQVLPGALPEVFSYRAVVGTGFGCGTLSGAAAVEPGSFPELTLGEASVRFAQNLVRRNDGVARQHLRGGTDAADYVLVSGTSADATPSGVLEVDGNCWVTPGAPVRLSLAQDLTIVVRGNLYLGDDVRVVGVGRLLLVALAGRGTVFLDEDQDGVWGAEERAVHEPDMGYARREGEGAVQLGWVGVPLEGGPEPVRVDAAVLTWGELRAYLGARFAGPVLARCGARGTAPVVGGADWSLRVGADGLPGLRTEGGPRPSALRRGRW